MYTTKRVKVDSIRFLLFEKGDLYSKIASVSILLLLCVVARSINEKEKKNAHHNQLTCKMQRNVAK